MTPFRKPVFRTLISGAALALTAAPYAATAQTPAAAPAPAASQDAEVQNAVFYLKVLMAALNSDKVEEPIKGALVGCLYSNSLGKISKSVDQLIKDNPDKIHRENADEVLSAMYAICTHKPEAPPAGAPVGR